MTMLAEQLNPTHSPDLLWDIEQLAVLLPQEIHRISEKFNATPYAELHVPLRQYVQVDAETGITYTLLQDADDSTNTIVVHFNPFANAMTENMLLRAEYCRQAFRALGMTDDSAQKLSVISFAALGSSSRHRIGKSHRLRMAQGQFDHLAAEYLQVVQRQGYKQLRIIGFSQGASLATAAAAIAPTLGLTVTHLAVGDPPNIMSRKKRVLIRDTTRGAKHFVPTIKASGIEAFDIAHQHESALKHVFGIVGKPRVYYSLLKGLASNFFIHDLNQAVKNGTRVTVGYGELTTISPPAVMHKMIDRARHQPTARSNPIHVVEVKNAHHSWADSLGLLATFYGYALMR